MRFCHQLLGSQQSPMLHKGKTIHNRFSFSEKKKDRLELLYGLHLGINEGTKIIKKGMFVIDIGSGPGALHGYLENKYSVNILGIDRDKWKEDYVDIEGDFTNTILLYLDLFLTNFNASAQDKNVLPDPGKPLHIVISFCFIELTNFF